MCTGGAWGPHDVLGMEGHRPSTLPEAQQAAGREHAAVLVELLVDESVRPVIAWSTSPFQGRKRAMPWLVLIQNLPVGSSAIR